MKRITVFVILLILFSSTSNEIKAATLEGSKCSKSGQTRIVGNKKYTCTKLGTKLSWNKGVLVKTTPTSTPAPSPIEQWQAKQFNILQELEKLHPSEIQKLNFILSPRVNKDNAFKLENSYQEPITLLSNYFVNPNPVTFLVFSDKDQEWWLTEATKLTSALDRTWWNGTHCKVFENTHCGYGSSPNPDGTFHFGQLLGSKFVWQDSDFTIAYHESIHVYQLGLLGSKMRDLPTWLAEGQAQYLGYVFSHKFVNSSTQRRTQLSILLSKFPELRGYSNEQWANFLVQVDSSVDFTNQNSLGYSIGELLMENLYNNFDHYKIHNWLISIKSGTDYKNGFKNVFNRDYLDWLRIDATKYLNDQIN